MDGRGERIQVFAILRIDESFSSPEEKVTVKEILPSESEAEGEVARLNRLNQDKGAKYVWRATRYYPYGRKASESGQMGVRVKEQEEGSGA